MPASAVKAASAQLQMPTLDQVISKTRIVRRQHVININRSSSRNHANLTGRNTGHDAQGQPVPANNHAAEGPAVAGSHVAALCVAALAHACSWWPAAQLERRVFM
ncbi:hypothetical protein OEZ85_014440 [Tetradesmus obliquus]|uniref:Uncharacterized protein n=1 Tax=Tetradesmus obliquus TaxID=3088 RepID=A0ABY8U844_TETOB|nr:hypothetical protein OEZ85_014440 [Tetradesmus obliquus]